MVKYRCTAILVTYSGIIYTHFRSEESTLEIQKRHDKNKNSNLLGLLLLWANFEMTYTMFTWKSLLQKVRARLESRSSTIVDLKYVLTSLSSLKKISEVHDVRERVNSIFSKVKIFRYSRLRLIGSSVKLGPPVNRVTWPRTEP